MATTGSDDAITFVISVAAELAGMHPQTLRQYDRLGLVIPARTKGRGRRYTKRDVQRLRDVQRMSQEEGINWRASDASSSSSGASRPWKRSGTLCVGRSQRPKPSAIVCLLRLLTVRSCRCDEASARGIAPRGLRLVLAALSPCGIRCGRSRRSPLPRPRRVRPFRLRRDRRRAQ